MKELLDNCYTMDALSTIHLAASEVSLVLGAVMFLFTIRYRKILMGMWLLPLLVTIASLLYLYNIDDLSDTMFQLIAIVAIASSLWRRIHFTNSSHETCDSCSLKESCPRSEV